MAVSVGPNNPNENVEPSVVQTEKRSDLRSCSKQQASCVVVTSVLTANNTDALGHDRPKPYVRTTRIKLQRESSIEKEHSPCET